MSKSIQTRLRHIILLLFSNLLLFGVGVQASYAQTSKVNSETPNLGFEKGTFEGWTRYYGYYGPSDFSNSASPFVVSNKYNGKTTTAADNWSERTAQITGTIYGDFQIMSSSSIDKNIACDNLKQVPDGSTYAVRIGSNEEPEIRAVDQNYLDGTYRRAMAERMVYKFTVGENSTLLTYFMILTSTADIKTTVYRLLPFVYMIKTEISYVIQVSSPERAD